MSQHLWISFLIVSLILLFGAFATATENTTIIINTTTTPISDSVTTDSFENFTQAAETKCKTDLCSKKKMYQKTKKVNQSETDSRVTFDNDFITENDSTVSATEESALNESANASNILAKASSSLILSEPNNEQSSTSVAAISGIIVGVMVCVSAVGSAVFYYYRNRYSNDPQTLNDKCSNPDSSGYIDDNTFKIDSEELYSLDNDSFLNSLEVMTIQSYWTDHIKHTKL